jgi:N-acetylglucosamine-6-phosphate deacetylase
MTTSVTALKNARVVTPQGVIDRGWVGIRDGRISAVGDRDAPAGAEDLGGAWLLPGYIDLHVHGGGGHDAAASPQDLAAAVAFHRRHGTTRTLVSLVTAPVDALVRQLDWIADLVAAGPSPDGHVVGAHLEGPFLSRSYCGAQNPAHLLEPEPRVVSRLLDAARGTLRSLTVAPELPGALELIRDVRAAGAVAALGHTGATYEEAMAAIDAGAGLATHLFNGMRPLRHREPGVIGAALLSGLAYELINDGIHVHPAITSLLARDATRLVLVTDAIDASGVGEGDFVLGGQAVRVRDGAARLVSTGSLAGSTLTMDAAVRRAVRDCGVPIEVASAAASGNPARVLGIADRCGAIAVGLDADLVVLGDDLRIASVIAGGRRCEAAVARPVS